MADFARISFIANPDFSMKAKSMFGAGDQIAREWVCSGTRTGEYPGLVTPYKRWSVADTSIILLHEY